MKKIVTLLIALCLGAGAYGQTPRDEWALSYSQITLPQTAYVLGNVLGVAFTMGAYSPDNMRLPGALSLEYTHYTSSHFGFGGTLTGDYMSADRYSGSEDSRTYDGKFRFACISLMPHMRAFWFNNPHFAMYSKLALGGACWVGASEEGTQFSFAAQLSPVCMDFGGDRVRGFLELGYGMQGVVSLGIKRRF